MVASLPTKRVTQLIYLLVNETLASLPTKCDKASLSIKSETLLVYLLKVRHN